MKTETQEPKEWEVHVELDFLDHQVTPLDDRHKIMSLILESLARDKSVCWVSNETLMERSGKALRAVQNTLADLESMGWIRRVSDRDESAKVNRVGFLLLSRVNPIYPVADPRTTDAKAVNLIRTARELSVQKNARRKSSACRKMHAEHAEKCTLQSAEFCTQNKYKEDVSDKTTSAPIFDATLSITSYCGHFPLDFTRRCSTLK